MDEFSLLAIESEGLLKEGKFDEALKVHDKMIVIQPERAEVWLNRGAALFQANRKQEALESFHKAAAIRSNFLQAHLNIGNIYNISGELELAEKHFLKVYEMEKSYEQIFVCLSNVLNRQKRYEEAIAFASEGIDYVKDDKMIKSLRMERILSNIRMDQVHRCLDDACAIYSNGKPSELPENQRKLLAFVFSRQGVSLINDKKPEDALPWLNQSLECDSNNVETLYTYSTCLVLLDQEEEASEILKKARKFSPDVAWRPALVMASTRMSRNEWEKALELFEEVICKSKSKEDNVLAINVHYAVTLMQLMKFFEAKEPLERVLSIEPDNSIVLNLLGTIYIHEHNYKTAVKILKKAAQLSDAESIDSSLHYNLGFANLFEGNIDEAEKNFRRVLEMEPHHEQAKRAISRIEANRILTEKKSLEGFPQYQRNQEKKDTLNQTLENTDLDTLTSTSTSRENSNLSVEDGKVKISLTENGEIGSTNATERKKIGNSVLLSKADENFLKPHFLKRRKSMENIDDGTVKALVRHHEDAITNVKKSALLLSN